MKKELLLYSGIYGSVAAALIQSMEECGNDEDLTMRFNTPGGDVLASWGIAAKMMERTGKTTIKVDGAAMSMGAALLCFADNVECLDVSTFMLHRADMYVEDADDQAFLDKVNGSLRAKMKSKIDDKKLKELTGFNMKNLFEDEKRVNLFLDAKQAKSIGLVGKINTLNPKEATAYYEKAFAIAAIHTTPPTPPNKPANHEPENNNTMYLQEIKADHPALYAQIIALGHAEGVTAERDRVESILAFQDVDAKGVKAAIESGKPLTAKQTSEFVIKMHSPEVLAKIAGAAAKEVVTGEADTKEVTAEQKKFNETEIAVRKGLGLDKAAK